MRYCKCGKSYGQYTDNINAEINKEAIPIGFSNSTFIYALLNRPETGLGKEFCAFVIPNHCESIKIIED
ncbi:hypothetical protein M0Q39_06735 [Patescibacteria group bacterium]|nr:hypothetical protein [Patescibacteria group bacterium]